VAVVASSFHDDICNRLLDGALEALRKCGVGEDDIEVFRVPGAFELPLALQSIANTETYHAAVALGVVIRGETSHYDYVAGEASAGISEVILKTGLPIGFGLLTTENIEQALDRAGGKDGNKGFDAALVALEMVSILEKIERTG
jgi:6,7-dimethyl-8-ribityllumazine synthase